MDTFIVWRQWWLSGKENWKPKTAGVHVDQNPFRKKGLHCVQGMLVLYDVNEHTGGLELLPNSHTEAVQEELRNRYPNARDGKNDWLRFTEDDPYQGKPKLVKAKAGDLILWDSRVIHGGGVGSGYSKDSYPLSKGDLARLAFTVTMTPKSYVSDPTVLFRRRKTFLDGKAALNHWPHEYHAAFLMGFGGKKITAPEYKPVEETSLITSLLGMSQE